MSSISSETNLGNNRFRKFSSATRSELTVTHDCSSFEKLDRNWRRVTNYTRTYKYKQHYTPNKLA